MDDNQHTSPDLNALPEAPRGRGEGGPEREVEPHRPQSSVIEHRGGVLVETNVSGREIIRVGRGREIAGSCVSAISVLAGLVLGVLAGGLALESVGGVLVDGLGGSGVLSLIKNAGVLALDAAFLLVVGLLGAVLGGFAGEGLTWRARLRDRL